MADVTETLEQAQQTFEYAQRTYENFNQKYKEAKAAVLSAQNTFNGVQSIGDRATIETSAQLLKNVQENLDRISANLLVAKGNVKAAQTNLENAKRAVAVAKQNQEKTKPVEESPNFTTISTNDGDLRLMTRPAPRRTPQAGGIAAKPPKMAPKKPREETKDDSPVKLTRAEYRRQLNQNK